MWREAPLYVDFYQGKMLVADSEAALRCYVDMIRSGEVMEARDEHKRIENSLSSTCRFWLVADMDRLLKLPETYSCLIPRYFLKNARFFGAFTIAIQLTSADDLAYPNIVLLYKE